MQDFDGKTIYSTIQEIVDPAHTALVVWDVQKMLVDFIFNKEEFINNINLLIESARRTKVPIFYTSVEMLPTKYESSARLYTYNKLFSRMQQQQRPQQSRSENMDLSPAVDRKEGEMVITKHTASIFIGTDFERMVRNADITTIIFTGIATELGVESSARDALNRDFYPLVVSDAVSSSDKDAHTRSLQNMENFLTVVSINEIMDIWSKWKLKNS
jgi:nicotinamidase-related amidase